MKQIITKIDDWKPARIYPSTYPGKRPDNSYLIVDSKIFLIYFEHLGELNSAYFFNESCKKEVLNNFLKKNQVPDLQNRYPVLAYGANRNPATISIKFTNYNYTSTGKSIIIPVLKGHLTNCDVVAGNISGQGYMQADLLVDSEFTKGTQVESWINLCDGDQLRTLNESEGISTGTYALAQFPGFIIDGHQQAIAPLGYAGVSQIFVSPLLKAPIAFRDVIANNRNLKEMGAIEMLDHLIKVSGTEDEIRGISGIRNNNLPVELSKYLNGQWWYSFNTGEKPLRGYLKILELLEHFVKENSTAISTTKTMESKGMLLENTDYNDPGKNYKFKRLLQ
jgi:hypothetical protein